MSDEQFEIFWRAFPRRIGKGAARKAFDRAIRKTSLPVMLHAIEEYVEHKPGWQDFCHPATWLNAERWSDEWDTPRPMSTGHGLIDALVGRSTH